MLVGGIEMLVGVLKRFEDGRWVNVDPAEMYELGQNVQMTDGKVYMVTDINGSVITMEEVEDDYRIV